MATSITFIVKGRVMCIMRCRKPGARRIHGGGRDDASRLCGVLGEWSMCVSCQSGRSEVC